MSEAIVDRFIGTAVVRDNVRIHILVLGPGSYQFINGFMEARFFQTLKKLTGFRNLTLVVQLADCNDYEDLKAATVASGVKWELEHRLGPFVVKSMTDGLVEHLWEKVFDITLELEFHPLKFHIDNPPAEAANLIKEVDRLGYHRGSR